MASAAAADVAADGKKMILLVSSDGVVRGNSSRRQLHVGKGWGQSGRGDAAAATMPGRGGAAAAMPRRGCTEATAAA
uniref:Uncharacterized protein n=1 Tax=Oryza rufipogon TaxID=4529 RepID=A0A0E0QNW9_ORYRU